MDGSRLPCSIRTQKSENLSRLEAQGQRVERRVPAELLRDFREDEPRSHGRDQEGPKAKRDQEHNLISSAYRIEWLYWTRVKTITRVKRESDSMKARPRVSKSRMPARAPG